MITPKVTWPLLALAVMWTLGAGNARAETWWAQAGWVRSDVGLAAQGNGPWAGVEGIRPLGTGLLELGYSLAYVQKQGSLNMVFSDIHEGNRLGKDAVILHYLQPALSLGLARDFGSVRARIYGAGAVDLKLSEQWDHPVGVADREYSYENLNLMAQVGMSLRAGSFMLEFRYSAGLLDQLLVTGVAPSGKSSQAEDTEGESVLPGPGGKISNWRLGLGVEF